MPPLPRRGHRLRCGPPEQPGWSDDEGDQARAAAVDPVDRKAREGHLQSGLEAVFSLEQAADAQRPTEEGRTRGKIVVTVHWDD
ncbi:zinc-binding dehydrogenase [Streptomyces sp. NPDC048411]|uniref:zinc-binding dehydrogenase n=1 Tax=Streptomyces sp. NPDC048411 TaxID=3157206 RepID=UPI003456E154